MFSNRKVGGIRFIRIGRINLSLSVSKAPARPSRPADGSAVGDALAALPILAAALAAFL